MILVRLINTLTSYNIGRDGKFDIQILYLSILNDKEI